MAHDALVGYTGFVGSNLDLQHDFAEKYNSKNAASLREKEFDLIVCAGVYSVKWIANQNPDLDVKQIHELENILSTVEAKRFVLISTVDVYPKPIGVDEEDTSPKTNIAPYGKHRFDFECFVLRQFPHATIVRLPGLFGKNIKKNIIFDLLNFNRLDYINPRSSFQYYDLSQLWQNIQTVLENTVPLINFATESLTTGEIVERFFPDLIIGQKVEGLPIHYDFHTRYAGLFGKHGSYISKKEEILTHLDTFIKNYRQTT